MRLRRAFGFTPWHTKEEMDINFVVSIIATWAASKPLVGRVWIFGSRCRADYKPDSDLDVAIELDMSHAKGVDESGGFATWALDAKDWECELATLLPFKIDLELYSGIATSIVHQALLHSSRLVYSNRKL